MLTKNFYAAMMALLGKTTSAALNKNGENINLGFPTNVSNNYGIFPYMFQYDAENAYQYVEFGNGTTPATAGDYKLENKITSGITVTTPSAVTTEQTDSYILWTVTFGVMALTETTISEIGLTAKITYSTGLNPVAILVDRTVLDTPITIPAGQSKQITYTIRFNYGDAT